MGKTVTILGKKYRVYLSDDAILRYFKLATSFSDSSMTEIVQTLTGNLDLVKDFDQLIKSCVRPLDPMDNIYDLSITNLGLQGYLFTIIALMTLIGNEVNELTNRNSDYTAADYGLTEEFNEQFS